MPARKKSQSKEDALIAQAVEIAKRKRAKALQDRAALTIRLATAEQTIREMDRMIAALEGKPLAVTQRLEVPDLSKAMATFEILETAPEKPLVSSDPVAVAAARVAANLSDMGSIPAGAPGPVSQGEILAPAGADDDDEENEGKYLPSMGRGWK